MADEADQKVPLLQELQKLAAGLSPADTPHVNDVPAIVGAIVKVLEYQDTTVHEDLYPEEPAPAAPAVPGSTSDTAEVSSLMDRFRAAVEAVERRAGVDRPDTAPPGPSAAPVVAGETDAPPAGPVDPNAATSGVGQPGTPPAVTSTAPPAEPSPSEGQA